MNQGTKKIIAREILIAFGTALAIGLVSMFVERRMSLIRSKALEISITLPDVIEFEKRLAVYIEQVVTTNPSQEETEKLVEEWVERERAKDKRFLKSASDYKYELEIYNAEINSSDEWFLTRIFYILLIVYPLRFAILILVWAIRVYFKSA